MKSSIAVLFSLALAMPVVLSAEKKPQDLDPIVWGTMSHNSGCVIFAEGKHTSGRFYGVAVTTKTVGRLTVIETRGYTYDQKVTDETQENMDNLMRLAQKDHVKFVKIPETHSPDLLEKARASCN
jgi:hypothetical protein